MSDRQECMCLQKLGRDAGASLDVEVVSDRHDTCRREEENGVEESEDDTYSRTCRPCLAR